MNIFDFDIIPGLLLAVVVAGLLAFIAFLGAAALGSHLQQSIDRHGAIYFDDARYECQRVEPKP